MVIAILFVTADITAALETPIGLLGFAIIDITYSAIGSKAGTSVLIAILLFMTAAGAISAMAMSSRLTWALARDRGLPGWRLVTKVCTFLLFSPISICRKEEIAESLG